MPGYDDKNRDAAVDKLCGCYDHVLWIMRAMRVDENDVEDLTEEVVADALKDLYMLRDVDKMMPWVGRIAANKASRYFKRRTARRETSNLSSDERGQVDIFDMVADERAVEDVVQEREEREAAAELVKCLPDINRRIIFMRFWEERKHCEIAEILDINLNTEKSIYRRSLIRLKKEYIKQWGG